MRRWFGSTAALLLAACASIPSDATLDRAQIGAAPASPHAQALANEVLQRELHEPGSARIGFGALEPGFYATGASERSQRFAWQLVASVDAKEPSGVFAGPRNYHFYFLDDRLVATATPRAEWTGRGYRHPYEVREFDGGGRTAEQAGVAPRRVHDDRR